MIEFFKENDIISRNNFNNVLENVGKLSNNLIINSDFKIWQRGDIIQLNMSSWTYTADRWRGQGSGQIVKSDKGLKSLNSTAKIQYIMEQEDFKPLFENPITLTYSINDTISVVHREARGHSSKIFDFILYQNDVLNWVKVSVGNSAFPYTPTIYGEEFVKCQRYYRKSTFMHSGFLSTDGNTVIIWGVPNNNMRVSPNVQAQSLKTGGLGVVDLVYGYVSSGTVSPFQVMSNANISRVILILPINANGMQGILIEDAEIY